MIYIHGIALRQIIVSYYIIQNCFELSIHFPIVLHNTISYNTIHNNIDSYDNKQLPVLTGVEDNINYTSPRQTKYF